MDSSSGLLNMPLIPVESGEFSGTAGQRFARWVTMGKISRYSCAVTRQNGYNESMGALFVGVLPPPPDAVGSAMSLPPSLLRFPPSFSSPKEVVRLFGSGFYGVFTATLSLGGSEFAPGIGRASAKPSPPLAGARPSRRAGRVAYETPQNTGQKSRTTSKGLGACLVLLAVMAIAVWPTTLVFADTDERDQQRQLAHQFEREVRPLLVGQCLACHGEHKQEGGLRLDSLEHLLAGGDSGPAIEVGDPEASLLIEAVHHDSFEMPPGKKLADEAIAELERWIATGAFWPEDAGQLRANESNISSQDRQWWAFQPLQRPDVPFDPQDEWSQTSIDRFVWDRLREHQLTPAAKTDRANLVRRLYFNLVGMPPTPDEVDAFVADDSPLALERTVDALLEDPRYGEHWARFWLDVVRYSESDGWNKDSYRPAIWRYRDYVVRALNDDMSYQQFVLDQLAGDEAAGDHPDGTIAAGFMRLGVYEYNQRDAAGQWDAIVNEMTDVTGDVFLGMSVSCARCHNHKFDPIPQEDYFKLRAFFDPVCWRDDIVATTTEQNEAYNKQLAVWEAATVALRHQLAAVLEPYESRRWNKTVDMFPLEIQACFRMPEHHRTSWQEQMAYLISRQYSEESGGPYASMSKEDIAKRDEIQKKLAAFNHLKPAPLPDAMTVTDFAGLHTPTIIADDPDRRPIQAGFLAVLSEMEGLPTIDELREQSPVRRGTSGNRTALARWITHPRNPLTTRVIVNRIWQQHFGQGLAPTSSDFGQLGIAPAHPELLDWLTVDFIENGWTFKRLHRQIVLSAVWQQSSHHPQAEQHLAVDPDERLLWRACVRRLKAEQIRDAMLVATGELQLTAGGGSITEDRPRRSVYLRSIRNQNDTFLHGFDVANGLQSVAVRDVTTTAIQSLLLFNGKYSRQLAEVLAQRLLREYENDPRMAVQMAFRRTWGREPEAAQFDQACRFIGLGDGEEAQFLDAQRFVDFCHVLFNSNQFLYLE